MEAGIIALLLAGPAVSAIVSTRVFPLSRPQGSALPSITVQRISGAPLYADEGEVGLNNGRVQVDCYGISYADAKDLSAAVKSTLSAVKDVSAAGVDFVYILVEDERDIRETGSEQQDYPFRIALDFDVWTT